MTDRGTMPEGVEADYFNPKTKCCTYHPAIPNFLVGGILKDETPELAEGRRRMLARLEARIGVTPAFVGPTAKQDLLYGASKGVAFGRSTALICPYLTDDGRCSVWRYRESICSTFHCKYDGGLQGFHFWKALKNYLAIVEMRLGRWAAFAIARDVVQPRSEQGKITLEELEDRPPSDAAYAKMWGTWQGREREYYIACFNKVRNLTRAEFVNITDTPEAKTALDELRKAYETLARPALLDRFALHPKMRRLPVLGGVAVTAPYNAYDSMVIEQDLFDVLERFDIREPAAAIRERLAAEGIELADELLDHLTRMGVLVGPATNMPENDRGASAPARSTAVTDEPATSADEPGT